MFSRTISARSQAADTTLTVAAMASLGAGAAVTALGAAAASLGAYFARQIVTPSRFKTPDTQVLAVLGTRENGQQAVLDITEDTTAPGTYGLWFEQGAGFARVGEIVEIDRRGGTVTRSIEQQLGEIESGILAFWTGAQDADPSRLGLGFREESISLAGAGEGSRMAPAWVFPAEETAAAGVPRRTAILIHGRGSSRAECLRFVPVFHRLGMDVQVITYRNDGEIGTTGLYGLGNTEWEDVEAWAQHALDGGAEEIVLCGISMGGAIALQLTDRSHLAGSVKANVLIGPVIDWVDVLAHQARINRIPAHVGRFGLWLLGSSVGRRAVGLSAPLNLKAMDWVQRADQLRTPTLILHSRDDDFVPFGPSHELAQKNPEIVEFVEFRTARHTKEYNVDPQKAEQSIAGWLSRTFCTRTSPLALRGDSAPSQG